jgi:hypothetical protein
MSISHIIGVRSMFVAVLIIVIINNTRRQSTSCSSKQKNPQEKISSSELRNTGSGAEWVVREGVGAGVRKDPSLICTYE